MAVRVCVVGSGGREHALAEALGRTATVMVTPGNAGIPSSTPTPPEELDADLYVIGPEVPLVDGLADRLRARGALVFGPGADGARLEGSKTWMKDVLAAAGVPTAAHRSFRGGQLHEANAILKSMPGPYVV
jgi:phosphoribosylamine---glycine ligase